MGQVSLPRNPAGLTPVAAQPVNPRAKQKPGTTLLLLVLLGLFSLLVGEQVLTGWLAFGDRANITRRDINPAEIIIIAASLLWGLLCLLTAWGILRSNPVVSMQQYFENRASALAPGVLLSIVLMGIVTFISLVVAEQVLTGWIALGDRTNISRRDLNAIEWFTIVACAIWALSALRTTLGLLNRQKRAWAWAQWMTLITTLIGFGVAISGMVDIHRVLPKGGTLLQNVPGALSLSAPGLLLAFSAAVVYQLLSLDVDTSAYQHVRNRLSKSPGAGAIVGFLVIAALFALSSDLFLEQRSLSGLLATNITRGIVAIGITFLMISGEFDLSVGSVYGAGALVFLLLVTEGIPAATLAGVPLILAGIGVLWLARGRLPFILLGVGAFVAAVAIGIGVPNVIVTSVIPAAIIALIFAGILGMINGVILVRTGIPSFIVTLGTLLAYRAILLVVVADGRILRYADYRLPPPNVYLDNRLLALGSLLLAALVVYLGFRLVSGGLKNLRAKLAGYRESAGDFKELDVVWTVVKLLVTLALVLATISLFVSSALGQLSAASPLLELSFFDLMNGRFDFVTRDVNLRIGVMWWMLLVIVFQFVLTQTKYGNYVFAVGGNPGAARAQGIDVNRIKITNFMLCSMLAAFAGIINVARLANVDPLMGDGLELEVIAASVIGGALLTGGYGSIVGSLLGVLIFGMLQTGLVLVGVDARAFSGVIGIIIILAVVINTAVRRVRT